MARQAGEIFITGTYDDLCFYKMQGEYYVRMKSSLTADRLKKSAAFANTIKSANELGTASVLASRVYRSIAKDKRKVCMYRKMTGMAKLLLKRGENKERISKVLEKYVDGLFNGNKPVVKPVVPKRRLFIYPVEIYHNSVDHTLWRVREGRRLPAHRFGKIKRRTALSDDQDVCIAAYSIHRR